MKIGSMLAKIREKSGINQKKLGKKMGVSTSRVSRMESETTQLSQNEIDSYLNEIGTEQAKGLKRYLRQEWKKINKPSFFHPSIKALRHAERCMIKIDELKKGIDPNSVFFKQLQMHEETTRQLAEYLKSTEHTIACIGSIGVGKTTAICSFSELKQNGKPVLHTGGGRSTICEVQIEQGPEYGIFIEPLSEDDIYKHISDFCDYLLVITSDKDENKEDHEAETAILSKEIERCIRNMSGLSVKRFKSETGYNKEDKAINLIKELKESGNYSDDNISDELKLQVLLRLNLENRNRKEAWFSKDLPESPLSWLTKTYFEINHGRHSEFSIPGKITIKVPHPLLSNENLHLKIIDTKGVDDTAKREDLERHLNDPRALTVFCSRFLDAPDETTRTLIERAIASGIKSRLKAETVIVVLPRDDEAIRVNTDDGAPIEDREEGYSIRWDDIRSDLMKYDLRDLSIDFFDERKDNPKELKDFLVKRIALMRDLHEGRINEVAATVEKLSENIEDAKAKAAFSEVLKSLTAWIKDHREIKPIGPIYDPLIDTIGEKSTHASSVRACVNRYGSWYNLDYYYQIGFGTRSETVKTISSMISDLNSIIGNMKSRPDLEPAKEFLNELEHFCDSETENLYQEIQRMGQAVFKERLLGSDHLWNYLQEQWGKGSGYKLRISGKTEDWFKETDQEKVHETIQNRIVKAWKDMLARFEDLAKGIFE